MTTTRQPHPAPRGDSFLLRGGYVVTLDDALGDLSCDVLVVDGKIRTVAPQIDADGVEEVAASDYLVLPGFIDSHRHTWQSPIRLTGSRTQVFYGPVADAFLVPAETDSGTAVFLVTAEDPGVTVTTLDTTGLGSVGHLRLDGAQVVDGRKVGDAVVATWLETLKALGRSAFQLGVLERGFRYMLPTASNVTVPRRPSASIVSVCRSRAS